MKAKKKTMILTLLVIVIVTLGTIGFIQWYGNRWQNHRRISYYAYLVGDEDTSSIVEIPMPNSTKLHNSFKITQGNGNFRIEETQYGKALHVEFSGEIRISAKYETYNPDDHIEKGLSMMTTANNEKNESLKMTYLHVVKKGMNISGYITLNHIAPITSLTFKVEADNLSLGWNIYPVEERHTTA